MKANWKRRFDDYPRIKTFLKRVLRRVSPAVSDDYVALDAREAPAVGKALEGAWQDVALPERQRELVDAQLEAYRAGATMPAFDAMVGALRQLALAPGSSLLDVGCSSGFYSEVLAARGVDVRYSGCDYSEAFIELARRRHTGLRFDVMDATRLGYPDSSFDVVVSGNCLLHIVDYPAAIAETARVARGHAIFHRTPVQQLTPTRYFTKSAYGVKTFEICFNETELVRQFAQNGLLIEDIVTIDAYSKDGETFGVKTYVCRKAAP